MTEENKPVKEEPVETQEAPADETVAVEEKKEPPKPAWGSTDSISAPSTQKNTKSLLDIMAEEQQQVSETKQARQEAVADDEVLRQAMEASLQVGEATAGIAPSEEDQIRLAIQLSMGASEQPAAATAAAAQPDALSPQEMAAIEQALRDAEEEESKRSFQLAVDLQSEEDSKRRATESVGSSLLHKGNVRTVTQAEYMREQLEGVAVNRKQPRKEDDEEVYFQEEAGFRINSSKPSAQWCRVDQGTIVGPNNEIRTKHDVELQGQANAHRLNLDLYEDSTTTKVGNQAFNSFLRKSD